MGGHGRFWKVGLSAHIEYYFDRTREIVWNQQCKTKCPSLYWGACRRHCIWGLSDLDQAISALLGLGLKLGSLYVTMESAGLLHADFCCVVADVMTDVTVQPVRRCMALIAAHDKRHCGMGVRRNLSTDRFCIVCQAAVYLQSAWCCMKRASQYLTGCKIYYLFILLFLFYLIKTDMLLCHFCWAFFTETPPKNPSASLPLPKPGTEYSHL